MKSLYVRDKWQIYNDAIFVIMQWFINTICARSPVEKKNMTTS